MHTLDCLQLIFYQDEFKVWLDTEELMCLPSVTWSSEAFVTPNANNKKMQAAVLIISLKLQFSADTIEMFSEVEIEILYGV